MFGFAVQFEIKDKTETLEMYRKVSRDSRYLVGSASCGKANTAIRRVTQRNAEAFVAGSLTKRKGRKVFPWLSKMG